MSKKHTKQLALIIGGARSGKSDFAQMLAARIAEEVTVIATAEAKDEEMRRRIEHHRRLRPEHWETIEAPGNVARALREVSEDTEVVLLDCATLLISNLLMELPEEACEQAAEACVKEEINALLRAYSSSRTSLIVVTNEVGLGVVPPFPLGRVYRDALGLTNKLLAAAADKVYWMIAGLPLEIKASGLAGLK
jgi:adenosylcobinamide kinase/adenosylcobinamide-phosphate guanylyltransferase